MADEQKPLQGAGFGPDLGKDIHGFTQPPYTFKTRPDYTEGSLAWDLYYDELKDAKPPAAPWNVNKADLDHKPYGYQPPADPTRGLAEHVALGEALKKAHEENNK